MSLKLVQQSENLLQFKSKNNKATIEMLKELLVKAENNQLTGIAGVIFTLNNGSGAFAAGEACHRPSATINELARLSMKMNGSAN